jgi:glycosyltransferase involved in cell wall biosynthesis
MKLLIFAHTPPPHHGQSYMVELMLAGFGGDRREAARPAEAADALASSDQQALGIECYHINARLSASPTDIGGIRVGKILRLLLYCLEAIWCRFRYGVRTIYFIPAPAKRSAIYRDWVVMWFCRPFFERVVLHWHAIGLGEWTRAAGSSQRAWEQRLTRRLLRGADLSIVATEFNAADAAVFEPKQIEVVPNGVPDPCPDFGETILPRRRERLQARRAAPGRTDDGSTAVEFRVLFLAHCTREKGLFDALDGVALANSQLRRMRSRLRLRLTVAGEFVSGAEEAEFRERIAQPDLQVDDGGVTASRDVVTYAGFVTGRAKWSLFADADCFCFPTYYTAESFGLVVVEALAFGLPVVTTHWRGLPELLPKGSHVVPIRDPKAVGESLIQATPCDDWAAIRQHFLARYLFAAHLGRLAGALRLAASD